MSLGNWLKKASPTILTILGAVGTVATAVMAVKATPDALKRKDDAQNEKGNEKLTLYEAVKAEAPAYITAATIGAGTLGCIFGANILSRKQQAILVSAYAMLNQMYGKYKVKVKSLFGEEGDYIVEKAISQDDKDALYDRPPWDEIQSFYFEPHGEFFERTMEQVFRAEYEVNHYLVQNGHVSVNEFLDFLDLEHVSNGDVLGWNLYDGECFRGYRWIDFSHRYFYTDDGLSVCSIEPLVQPHQPDSGMSNQNW